MKKIILVAGARPNFMKIAPVLRAIDKKKSSLQPVLVHTGQHYDRKMSGAFFDELGIREPEYNLEIGSGSHAVQTANIMIKFEEVCLKEKPDWVVVVGDVNSTIAASLVAKKLNIGLAHIEAGLRSRDRTMPEEINRLTTDAISDLFFTTEPEGTENLISEGHSSERVHFVGHVMIDNLFFQLNRLSESLISDSVRNLQQVLPEKYVCMTMHRPSNVDDPEILRQLMQAVQNISRNVPVIFPCHPRTRKNLSAFNINSETLSPDEQKEITNGLVMLDPLGYNDFLSLWKNSSVVLTDSGGLQEETTALKIPCVTMRENTERPVTASIGSNVVAGINPEKIIGYVNDALGKRWKHCRIPDLWDGKASERIVDILETCIFSRSALTQSKR
ncbi:MAG: UDP-N-acetylglucosamine 2-epimerase (non-hydrolyzing) [Fibrobacter sp.]|nr:UDP-N-acetylglucosamine 2-epimerase (non-hydrolyzing) [Fibrobacter sp.]